MQPVALKLDLSGSTSPWFFRWTKYFYKIYFMKILYKNFMSPSKVYIPCILFVTVSWISFIIDPKVRKFSTFD